jgi:short-subunit dehydrogenase
MAQGVRVQVVLPLPVAQALKDRAAREQRSLSNLAAQILESANRPTTA